MAGSKSQRLFVNDCTTVLYNYARYYAAPQCVIGPDMVHMLQVDSDYDRDTGNRLLSVGFNNLYILVHYGSL